MIYGILFAYCKLYVQMVNRALNYIVSKYFKENRCGMIW